MKKLREKLNEAFAAVLPISLIVLVLSLVLMPMDVGTVMLFIFGAILLIIGMALFQLGAETAMIPMGEGAGVQISKTRSLFSIVVLTFAVGVLVTIAEPDLQVLANEVPSIPNPVLIWTVAIGVGLFLVCAILKILFKISLNALLLIFYGVLFALAIFVPKDFLSVAFDAGGVTTGPITVPFIMAMGVGIAAVRSDKNAAQDSFGLVALCSIGPILSVMILGIFFNPTDATYTPVEVPVVETTRNLMREFAYGLPTYLREVSIALLPIIVMFFVLQIIRRRYTAKQIKRMLVGFFYTYVGLVLFLTGVNVGFMPVGHLFGSDLAKADFKWLLVPLGMLIGFFIVKAEPAVQVLNHQIEEVTNGAISHKVMNRALQIGVSVSVGLSMIRVLTGISILYFLIPGYIIAMALTFFVPKIFVGIAFDSGGVCSGPMTTTFLLPLAMGACEALGGNVMTDAFGVVAFVAMTPLIAVQVVGLLFVLKEKRLPVVEAEPVFISEPNDDEIIDIDEEDFSDDLS